MWDHGKDMIIQVDDVYLVCLIHYDYQVLIPWMNGYDERKFSSQTLRDYDLVNTRI